jgi:hypothetical protein
MDTDLSQTRQEAHALLNMLPPEKLRAVWNLLNVMIDVDDEELTDETRAAIEAGIASLDRGEGIPHEEILREFGLTSADFDQASVAPDPVGKHSG